MVGCEGLRDGRLIRGTCIPLAENRNRKWLAMQHMQSLCVGRTSAIISWRCSATEPSVATWRPLTWRRWTHKPDRMPPASSLPDQFRPSYRLALHSTACCSLADSACLCPWPPHAAAADGCTTILGTKSRVHPSQASFVRACCSPQRQEGRCHGGPERPAT